jgi:hypothetical protein
MGAPLFLTKTTRNFAGSVLNWRLRLITPAKVTRLS